MTQPYDVAGALPHDPNEWEWRDEGANGGYWVLKSGIATPKGYNCTEYAVTKLFGEGPAEWGGGADPVDEHEIYDELTKKRGFTERASAERCGCGADKISACAVLYYARNYNGTRAAMPFHVEVFDREHCDWGGKGNAGTPIRHRQHPHHFPVDPAERAKTEMVFLCQEGAPGRYVSDAEIHEGATLIASSSGLQRHFAWAVAAGVLAGLALYRILTRRR